jgi:hypothetical protein
MDNIEKKINTKSTGGFPPIYICKEENKKKNDNDYKSRGFSKDDNKIVVSVKDIMEERRTDIKPFIIL